MARIFFGIRPPKDIVTQVQDLSEALEGVHWQKEEQLHITVCYVGDVSGWQLERIVSGLDYLDVNPFYVSLEGVNWFDGGEGIAHLWAGVEPDSSMRLLHSEVRDKLRSFDVDVEHQLYLPHLTVARLDRSFLDTMSEYVERRSSFHSDAFAVGEVWLCESSPDRYGSGYRYLKAFPLRKK